jgi:D-arabinose 1-dehydrogenase-like Zn-dependent alcohol dehydrogenase
MKAAQVVGYHRPIQLVDVPEPTVSGPLDVVVRIGGAGICRTDLHILQGELEAAFHPRLPYTLGHENAGWIEEVGAAVTHVAPGDPVIVHPAITCGLCEACRAGNDMHCPTSRFPGVDGWNGGYAELLKTSTRSVVKLPADVDPADVAPHADAGLTAYHAVKRAAHVALPGTTAVVIGVGGVGHVALQLLRELGSSRIVAVDPSADRRRLAGELGADEVLDGDGGVDAVRDLTGGRGAELVLDFVGSDQTHGDSLAMLARGGTYSIVGYGGTLTAPSGALVGSEHAAVANLVGSWVDLWEVLQLHARGTLTLKTEEHPLEDVNDVLARLREGEITGRAVLVPNGRGEGA